MTKEEYWNLKADKPQDNILKRQEIVRRLLGLNLAKTDVLEIGAGLATAAAALSIVYLWNWRYKGLDVSKKTVAMVRDRFSLDLQQGEIISLPFEDASFDTVLLFDVLEHVEPRDRIAGYHEISRVLRPFGRVVINMPLDSGTHNEDFDFGFSLEDLFGLLHHCELELDTYEAYLINYGPGVIGHHAWVVGVR